MGVGGTWVKAEENILIIHSYHPELSWTQQSKQGIDKAFQERRPDAKIFHEYLDSKRRPALEHAQLFLDLIRKKYEKIPLAVLMVADDPGLKLILSVRDRYFQKVPIVFMGINHVQPELLNMPGLTGIFEKHSIADYPPNWPVLALGQLRQDHAKGELINFETDTEILRTQLPNPIFTESVMRVGHGAVDGKVLKGGYHADQAVQLVEKILEGADPTDLPPIVESKNWWLFDARELQRFQMDTKDLPATSKVLFTTPSFYHKHRSLVWIVLVAFASALVMIALLMEVIRRRAQAAKTLGENERRYKDLAEVGANTFWELDVDLKLS